jgi:tetratricopeptide (TPR) repeat protein
VTPERWDEMQALFVEVLDLEPAERAERLDAISESDPELSSEVWSILEAHERADYLLDPLEDLGVPAGFAEAGDEQEERPVGDPYGLVGRIVSHYEVVEPLGGGGMGVLYKAADTRLDRTVALKFLPPQWSLDRGFKERFEREARAAAALDHPNVCNIHEIGETEEGQLFIAMAFYDGKTVREKLARGPLSAEDAVGLAAQAASGLAAAHAQGIVHRDIKPGNLMVTEDGVLKILDFGLAKTAETALTASGMRLGTPAYMSPEQTRGGEITPSTDLWSLGVVLYEMLTGQRPFRADNDRAVISAIRHEEPPPPSELREGLAPAIEALVPKLLSKDPAGRPESAEVLLADLAALAPHAVPIGIAADGLAAPKRAAPSFWAQLRPRHLRLFAWRKSMLRGTLALAVLGTVTAAYLTIRARGTEPPTLIALGVLEEREPLVLAEFEGPDTVLARTVTEALRIDLSASDVVKLVSQREVAQALVHMQRDLRERLHFDLAREIAIREGIKGVIGGSVGPAGSGYVLTARLVAAEGDEVLIPVRETAAGPDEVIDALDRLSRRLRRRIGESLESVESSPPMSFRVSTSSLEALNRYTAARSAQSAGDMLRALALYEEAARIDTAFALAHVKIALMLANMGVDRARAVEAAMKAFELRDRATDKERYYIEGIYHYFVTGDMERALAANDGIGAITGSPQANAGHNYRNLGDYESADSVFASLGEAYPTQLLTTYQNMVSSRIDLDRTEEADSILHHAEEQLTDHPSLVFWKGYLAAATGRYADAAAHLRVYRTAVGNQPNQRVRAGRDLARIAEVRGRLDEAVAETDSALALDRRRGLAGYYLLDVTRLASALLLVWGDREAALAAVSDALREYPLDYMSPYDRPYEELAWLYAAAGEVQEARDLLAAYEREVEPKHRSREVSRVRAEAELALRDGDPRSTIRQVDLAHRIPNIGCRPHCTLPLLGRAYEMLEEPDSALAAYQSYIEASRRFPQWDALYLANAYERLGQLYDDRGEWERASEHYARFVELWKDADPELQPRVEAARERLEEMSRIGRNR